MSVRRSSVLIAAVALVPLVLPHPVEAAICGELIAPPQPVFEQTAYPGIAADSPTSAWAVGTVFDYQTGGQHGVAVRWDGTSWVRTRIARPIETEPKDVAAADGRAWMASRFYDVVTGGGDSGSRLQHWNGVRWHPVVDAPAVLERRSTVVWTIDASARNDVWAVGDTFLRGIGERRMVTIHWNGRRWRRLPAPLPTTDPSVTINVYDVVTAGPDDAWMVGDYFPFGQQAFALHWDGDAWSLINPPELTFGDALYAVDGAGDDVWAVGKSEGSALVLRWDGTSWSRVPLDTRFSTNHLEGVVVSDAGVAVTGVGWNGFPPDPRSLFFTWDGSAWAEGTFPSGTVSLGRASSPDGESLFVAGYSAAGRPRALVGCLP